MKSVTTLVATTYRNMESTDSCKSTYMVRTKESERRTFFKIFRWNIVLYDSNQADEVAIEIEEWGQKISGFYVKSFSRVLLSVFETSVVP